jgi:hypothetical protein
VFIGVDSRFDCIVAAEKRAELRSARACIELSAFPCCPMSDQPPVRKPAPKSEPAKPAAPAANAPAADLAAKPPKALTPEEQMEAFEKDLKENDWGHQPC